MSSVDEISPAPRIYRPTGRGAAPVGLLGAAPAHTRRRHGAGERGGAGAARDHGPAAANTCEPGWASGADHLVVLFDSALFPRIAGALRGVPHETAVVSAVRRGFSWVCGTLIVSSLEMDGYLLDGAEHQIAAVRRQFGIRGETRLVFDALEASAMEAIHRVRPCEIIMVASRRRDRTRAHRLAALTGEFASARVLILDKDEHARRSRRFASWSRDVGRSVRHAGHANCE